MARERPQDGDVFPVVAGCCGRHSLTLRRSGIMPGQGDSDTGLIQEHTRAHLSLTELLVMEATWFVDRFTVTRGCLSSRFCRVRLSQTRVRCRLERRGWT